MWQRMRIIISLTIIILMSGCRTDTALDAFVYESEILYQSSSVQEELCSSLEDMGYKFDMFRVTQTSVMVDYLDSTQEYPLSVSVGARAITWIERDWDGAPSAVSDEELTRFEDVAVQLCEDIKTEAHNLLLGDVGVGFVLYDWVNGVTIRYAMSDPANCSTIQWQSVFTGGYGHEENFEESICSNLPTYDSK